MALFKKDWNKPGPGVPKNAPKKKGIARFFEILGRDIGGLVKLNLLMQLCYLPSQACLLLSVLSVLYMQGQGFLLFGLLGVAFSIPVGPARTAESYLIAKMLRDDPGFLWHDFKRVFKENFRSTVVPGVLFSFVFGAQILAILYYLMAGDTAFGLLVALLLSVLLFAIVIPYFYLQAAYVDLGAWPLLKNSLLLALGNAPRSLAGGLLALALTAAQWWVFPYAFLITLIIGYTLPAFINLMWIWPVVDKAFKIDETLQQRAKESVGNGEQSQNENSEKET